MLRRRFLLTGAAAGLGTGVALWMRSRAHSATRHDASLVADPKGILDLPVGFQYQVIERAGDPMTDGLRVPALADGMACFEGPKGTWVVMRNHEVPLGRFGYSAFPEGHSPPPEMYDPRGAGGVTRLVIDGRTLKRVSSNLVLAGTVRNCAGGPSPWGWLSCEESTLPGHGYVFVCPSDADRLRPPRRVLAYGRYNHEAVAIDPETLAAYLTEDHSEGCLYRMLPPDKQRPFEGPLDALAFASRSSSDTAHGMRVGESQPVRWVRVDKPVPTDGTDDPTRVQATQQGAAIVRRGEGIWYADGSVYFTATIGGPAQHGQVFELKLDRSGKGGTLKLVAQSEDPRDMDMPDNLVVTPWGDLLVCEDGPGSNFLRIVKHDGSIRPLARNASSPTELTGACFSPDGRALFVNLQHEGLTLVVTGPWEQLA